MTTSFTESPIPPSVQLAAALRKADFALAATLAEAFAHTSAITAPITSDGLRPLHYAAMFNDAALTRALLRSGAVVDERALEMAASHDSAAALMQLIFCASGEVVNGAGAAVFEGAFAGSVECVRMLVHAGAPTVHRGKDGSTPLHLAAVCGSVAMVDILISAGASPCATSHDGSTPAVCARRVGHLTVASRLRAAITSEQDGAIPLHPPLKLTAPVKPLLHGHTSASALKHTSQEDELHHIDPAEPPCGHKVCKETVTSSPRTVAPLSPQCFAPP